MSGPSIALSLSSPFNGCLAAGPEAMTNEKEKWISEKGGKESGDDDDNDIISQLIYPAVMPYMCPETRLKRGREVPPFLKVIKGEVENPGSPFPPAEGGVQYVLETNLPSEAKKTNDLLCVHEDGMRPSFAASMGPSTAHTCSHRMPGRCWGYE